MFGTTMLLTIGQALDRAQLEGASIRLGLGGEWLTGRVLNTDSQGVVIAEESGDLCVVRMEAITCVRLPLSRRQEARAQAGPGAGAELGVPAQPTP